MNKLKSLLLLTAALAFLPGCRTTNPETGEREFDPVKTEQVKATIEAVAIPATRRVIVQAYHRNPRVIAYFEYAQETICGMRDAAQFSPSILVDGLNKGLSAEIIGPNVDPLILDVKEMIIGLYKLNYGFAGNADLSEEKFLWNLLDSLCRSIERAVTDAKTQLGISSADMERLRSEFQAAMVAAETDRQRAGR